MTKGKLKTPDWVLSRGKKPSKKKQERTFKIRKCPECGSDDVGVVIGTEKGEWECNKCKWKGIDIVEDEVLEGEFMKYMDKKGEGVA